MNQDISLTENKTVGRKSVITPKTVEKLKGAFALGFNDKTACEMAHIDRSTYYRHLQSDSDFATDMLDAQNMVKVIAADRVVKTIKDDHHRDNAKVAMWALERKSPEEFGNKAQVVVSNVHYVPPSWFEVPEEIQKVQEADVVPQQK